MDARWVEKREREMDGRRNRRSPSHPHLSHSGWQGSSPFSLFNSDTLLAPLRVAEGGEPERRRDLIGLEGGRATAVVAQDPGTGGRRRRSGVGWGGPWPRDRLRPSRSLARPTRTDELPTLRTRRGIIVWSAVGAFPRAGRPCLPRLFEGRGWTGRRIIVWKGAEQV